MENEKMADGDEIESEDEKIEGRKETGRKVDVKNEDD